MDQRNANDRGATHRNRPRYALWMAAILLILGLAWFDGGEEAVHPISQEISIPELAE